MDEVAAYQCGSLTAEAPPVRLHIGGASKETLECSVRHPLNKEPDNVTDDALANDGTQCIGSGGGVCSTFIARSWMKPPRIPLQAPQLLRFLQSAPWCW